MRAYRYQIIVSGRLGMVCCDAFREFQIEPHGTDTVLTGDLTRSGLHDALTLIRDLALDLVGFTCLAPELIVPISRACGPDADQPHAGECPARLGLYADGIQVHP